MGTQERGRAGWRAHAAGAARDDGLELPREERVDAAAAEGVVVHPQAVRFRYLRLQLKADAVSQSSAATATRLLGLTDRRGTSTEGTGGKPEGTDTGARREQAARLLRVVHVLLVRGLLCHDVQVVVQSVL